MAAILLTAACPKAGAYLPERPKMLILTRSRKMEMPLRINNRSIRFQLACLVLVAVLPVWLVAGFLVVYSYNAKCAQVSENMLDSAHSLTMVVDRELSAVQAALQALATSPSFASGDLRNLQHQATQLLKSYPGADIIVADASGQQLVNSTRPFGSPLPRRNNLETVRRIFQTGKPVISDLYYGAISKKALISIDIPVLCDGKIAYDLAMTFPSGRIASILLQEQFPQGWYATIMDSKAIMVARSRHPEKYVGQPAGPALSRAMQRAPEGVLDTTNIEGEAVIASFYRSPLSTWVVVVGVPKSAVMAGVYQWLGWAVAGLSLLSLGGITVALIIGRRIIRAEDQVQQAHGDLEQNEARLRLALAAARLAIWDWHVPSGGVVWNDQHYRMMGYQPGEVQPSYEVWASRVHPDDRDDIQATIQRSMAEGEVYISTFRTLWPDGTVRWLEVRGEFEYDASRQPLRCYGVMSDITEARRAQEAVSQSQKIFSDLIERSPFGTYVVDAGLRIAIMNSASQSGSFRNVPSVLGSDLVAALNTLWPAEVAAEIVRHFRHTLETGEAYYSRDFVKPRQDAGVVEAYEWELHRMTMPDGDYGVICYYYDFTKLRHAEAALRGSEERYRLLAETMLQGVVHHDGSGAVITMNLAAERILGRNRGEMIGRTSVKLERATIREDGGDFPGSEHPAMVALRTGQPVEDVVMGVFNPLLDAYRWININAVPLYRQNDSAPFEVYSVFEDITERKQAGEALRASEEKFSRAFANNPAAIVLSRFEDGVFLEVNDTWMALNERTREEVIGRSARTLRIWPSTGESGLFLAELNKSGVVKGWEQEFYKKSGERFVAQLSAQVLIMGEERVILSTLVDITTLKAAEHAMKILNEELEDRVVRRTEELRKKDEMLLLQSRQAAMGEMIGNIAHQWRQPLNTLGLAIQQLELFYEFGEFTQELLSQSVKNSMEIIGHMSKTIDDFRNYFRPDKEKVQFKLSSTIESTLFLINDTFKNNRIRIEFIAKEDPEINGYPNEFAQVLLNILNNARDAFLEREVDNPGVTITLGSEGNRCYLSVVDNAGGIPDEIITKIFDPYFSTKGPQQGTGIGLYMSKSIIEKSMGGRLSVRNLPGGAEFRIEV
jgi:PAS domain S-box-containing protein